VPSAASATKNGRQPAEREVGVEPGAQPPREVRHAREAVRALAVHPGEDLRRAVARFARRCTPRLELGAGQVLDLPLRHGGILAGGCTARHACFAREPAYLRRMETLVFGYGLVEAPRIDGAGNLYFSDAIDGGVYRRAPDGAVSVVVPKRRGVGGLALHADGGLVISGKDVSHVRDGVTRILLTVEGALGFNDLTTDAAGHVFVGSLRSPALQNENRVARRAVARRGRGTGGGGLPRRRRSPTASASRPTGGPSTTRATARASS